MLNGRFPASNTLISLVRCPVGDEMGSRYLFICLYVWLENTSAAEVIGECRSSVPLSGQTNFADGRIVIDKRHFLRGHRPVAGLIPIFVKAPLPTRPWLQIDSGRI